MIVGTAGHIDHGKTALVKALTGIDADRLREEKARGITLDLGYAYQPLATGEVLGFVDVPGHERLVHNMVAGATGIDYVLLVVAADDGPMPQTRQHLEILDLLGLGSGAVALTKIDRVAAERLAEVEGEVAALLAATGLEGSALFPVSSITGEGVAALREHLHHAAITRPARPADARFRLAIDRAFTLTGTGTVVTGTVHSGRVAVDDRLLLSPLGLEARVRGIHAQNRPAAEGRAGQRCALNLSGPGVEKERIRRGDWLLDPALHLPGRRLDAVVRVLPGEPRPLRHWTPVHLHLGAVHVTGRVAVLDGDAVPAGEQGLVQLVLDQPLVCLHGDRFILRDQTASRTVAGGEVLDLAPPSRGRRTPVRLALLRALHAPDPATALAAALEQAPHGLDLARFALHRNLSPAMLEALRQRVSARWVETSAGPFGFTHAQWQALEQRALAAVDEEHLRAPWRQGLDRERLRRMVGPTLPRPAFAALLEGLARDGSLVKSGPWMHRPEHRLRLEPEAERLWRDRVIPLLRATPYNPPRVRDIARTLEQEEGAIRQLLKQLTEMGELFRVAHDHYFLREAVDELAELARALTEREGEARAAAFRDRIGTGRKVAIHILEFFDRIGYCRRIGDAHRVHRDSLLEFR